MLLYAGTIFLSAFLLFLVQPVIAKQILPWFGGAAAVWAICLVFFQSVLLVRIRLRRLDDAPSDAAPPGVAAPRPPRVEPAHCCRSFPTRGGSPLPARSRRS